MSLPALNKPPFTIHSLPYGVISTTNTLPRCAVAIGDHAVDLTKYTREGRLMSVSKDFPNVELDTLFNQVRTAKSTTTDQTQPSHAIRSKKHRGRPKLSNPNSPN